MFINRLWNTISELQNLALPGIGQGEPIGGDGFMGGREGVEEPERGEHEVYADKSDDEIEELESKTQEGAEASLLPHLFFFLLLLLLLLHLWPEPEPGAAVGRHY